MYTGQGQWSWRNKRILITGGTGTFGRALIQRLIQISEIERIIVFSRDEFKQHEMRQVFSDSRIDYFLGDVRDKERLSRAFNHVDIVIHAAALKQVPALEYNPLEAVKTNILGTQNVIDTALDRDVEKVIFISSDKAVYPVNLYGATKLTAERLTIASNVYRGARGKAQFSVMRYGNVVGSRGSFIELIEKQKETGSITLTDDRMTRFWIHIGDVTDLVVNAIENMQGGEIFVPKMKSLKVVDVVETLAPECKVKKIGIRPGEKLHEILITEHEASRTREAGPLYVVLPEFGGRAISPFSSKKKFPQNSVYSSDHKDYLQSKSGVTKVLKL
jgi:UDP-N-acetylglucosamine 4,6-dehydratase/5-epimerase